jgi:type I restriction enzyme S subunit
MAIDQGTFFDNFVHFADAPNGVKKLRELILQLAVQGKLVSQDPKDEPASKLLARIRAEKARLVKEKKIRAAAPAPQIDAEETLQALPQGWIWTCLAEVGVINPVNDIGAEVTASFVPMTLISDKYGTPVTTDTRPWSAIKKGFTHFAENDVVLAKITPCFQNGKSTVMRGLENGVGAGTTELHVFRRVAETMCPEYVHAYLKTPSFITNGIPKMTGSAGQKRVPKEYFAFNPFPLPPLPEQHRIVAKVDQLMALCDGLEAKQQRSRTKLTRLNNAVLDRLTSARETDDFAPAWELVRNNFDLLYTTPETIAKLRQSILQLAVQGKLVPQDPTDEPASVLLTKIKDEKERLVKEKKIRKSEPLPPVSAEEAPYELPQGWKWVRLGDLGSFLGGGTPSKEEPSYWNGNIPWVSPKDMKVAMISDSIDHISTCAVEKSSAKLILEGSLLMVVRGMILAHSFPVSINLRTVTINQDMKAIVFFQSDVAGYMLKCLSGDKHRVLKLVEHSSHGTCRIDSACLEKFVVALPPLAEQLRIVAKVDQLMALCDNLETRLTKTQAKAEKLTSASVQGLLAA